jgi:hypothetical protein
MPPPGNHQEADTMAKLNIDRRHALEAGYAEGERCSRSGGRARYLNPHPWGSPLHRAFEFGYYVQEKGLTLGATDYWQSKRGGAFVSPDGATFKLWCDRNGLGIQRLA